MSSAAHELMIDLLGKTPDVVHELLGPRPDERLSSATTTLRYHRSDTTVSKIPPLGCDLCFEVYDDASTPLGALVVEVQLHQDDDKRYTWVAYQAGQYCRLRVPTQLVVVTNDRDVARWAAEPIWSGQTWLTPIVRGPGDVAAITDIDVAKRSPVRAFVSGIVHGKSMTAVPIGLALAHALEASHDDDLASHWDTFLASLSEPVRKELEMQLEHHYRLPRSDWGRKFFDEGQAKGEAKGEAKGRASAVVSLLVFRGVLVTREHRERILACTDVALLDQWLLRAATAGSIDEVFAA
jgi:hypothetical protein